MRDGDEKVQKFVVGDSDSKRPLERNRHSGKDNIKIHVKKQDVTE